MLVKVSPALTRYSVTGDDVAGADWVGVGVGVGVGVDVCVGVGVGVGFGVGVGLVGSVPPNVSSPNSPFGIAPPVESVTVCGARSPEGILLAKYPVTSM